MKTYQYNKSGKGTPPGFERELDFFIPVGIILLETEECSSEKNGTAVHTDRYNKEVKTNDY